ncbi:CHASE4 domain-containing protein [Sphingomonas humi]|uniref:CHASE4 domain-containing protein n=1 Tax=Sphingomonas humi TaxID=335630 RepID=A0ABP7RMF2_9SPHN
MIVRIVKRLGGFREDTDLVSLRAVMRPLSLILVLTLSMCVTLLGALVVQMDQRGAEQVQWMMRGAVETRLSALKSMTRDYGRWDDAVVHLYGRLDRRWAVDNLSNATHVLIIDRQGQTLFSAGPDGSAGVDGRKAMPEGIAELLAMLPTSSEGAQALDDAVGLIVPFEGRPMLVAAMPIIPFSERVSAPAGEMRYVIITQALDQSLLSPWQNSFGLRGAAVVNSLDGRDPSTATALADNQGRAIGYIVWDPVQPGREAALAILPYLLVGWLVLGISCVFLSTRVVGIVRALSREQDAARRSAQLADANLEIARQAQISAEAAKLRAEQLASHAESARREAEMQEQNGGSAGFAKPLPKVA